MWDQGKSISVAAAITKKRQIEIAEKTGITPQRISSYKTGNQKMTIPVAERLASAFEMKLSEFIKLGE